VELVNFASLGKRLHHLSTNHTKLNKVQQNKTKQNKKAKGTKLKTQSNTVYTNQIDPTREAHYTEANKTGPKQT